MRAGETAGVHWLQPLGPDCQLPMTSLTGYHRAWNAGNRAWSECVVMVRRVEGMAVWNCISPRIPLYRGWPYPPVSPLYQGGAYPPVFLYAYTMNYPAGIYDVYTIYPGQHIYMHRHFVRGVTSPIMSKTPDLRTMSCIPGQVAIELGSYGLAQITMRSPVGSYIRPNKSYRELYRGLYRVSPLWSQAHALPLRYPVQIS